MPKVKVILISIFIVGVILRFVFLDRMSFWADEFQMIEWSSPWKSSGQIIHQNLTFPDQSPPLFTLLLHAWMKVPSIREGLYPSERWIRFLPALISFFSLIFLIRLFVFPWQGLISLGTLLIFSCSSFYLYFSREVRPYGFVLLMTILSTLAFRQLLDRGKKLEAIIYALSIFLGVLTNPFIWLVFVSHLVYLIIVRDRARLYRLIKLAIPSIAVYIPYSLIIVKQFKIYQRPSPFSFFVLKKIAGLFFNMTLGFNFPTNIVTDKYAYLLRHPIFILSLGFSLLVGVFSLVNWRRICRQDRLAFISFLSVIVPLILVFFIYPRRFSPRPLVMVAPFLHYLLVKGIFFKESWRPVKMVGLLFLLVTIFFGFKFVTLKVNPYVPEDWKGLAAEIKNRDQDKTIVFIPARDFNILGYYQNDLAKAQICRYSVKGVDIETSLDTKELIRAKAFDKILFIRNDIAPYSPHQGGGKMSLESLGLGKTVEIKSFGLRLDLWIGGDPDGRK